MEDLDDKVTGGALTALQWNDTRTEAQNVVTGTGQALSGSDPNQLGKAIAQYAANGDFYTDGGVANAYTLTTLESKQAPPSYVDGMRVRFETSNPNTGAATVSVSGLGVKDIRFSGSPLVANQITSKAKLVYSLSDDWFELESRVPIVTIHTANNAAWAPNAATEYFDVVPVSGGGGAGGVDGQGAATAVNSGAGNGGGTAKKFGIIPSGTYNLQVGVAGIGGVAGDNDGTDGGDTSITGTGVAIVVPGGKRGSGMTGTASTTATFQIQNLIPTGGDINAIGTAATRGNVIDGNSSASNTSGFSVEFGGGRQPTSSANGADAEAYGEGGGSVTSSNSATNYSGGDGFQGVIITTEHFG